MFTTYFWAGGKTTEHDALYRTYFWNLKKCKVSSMYKNTESTETRIFHTGDFRIVRSVFLYFSFSFTEFS